MRFAQGALYLSTTRAISVVLDGGDLEETGLEEAFIDSCGEKYVRIECLYPPRHRIVHLLPGGSVELLGGNTQEVKGGGR